MGQGKRIKLDKTSYDFTTEAALAMAPERVIAGFEDREGMIDVVYLDDDVIKVYEIWDYYTEIDIYLFLSLVPGMRNLYNKNFSHKEPGWNFFYYWGGTCAYIRDFLASQSEVDRYDHDHPGWDNLLQAIVNACNEHRTVLEDFISAAEMKRDKDRLFFERNFHPEYPVKQLFERVEFVNRKITGEEADLMVVGVSDFNYVPTQKTGKEIFKKAGKKLIKKVSDGYQWEAATLITKGYDLPSRNLCIARVPAYHDLRRFQLYTLYSQIFYIAYRNGCKTLSIYPMGAECGGYPRKTEAEVIFYCLKLYLLEYPEINVRFTIFFDDEDDMKFYKAALAEYTSEIDEDAVVRQKTYELRHLAIPAEKQEELSERHR